MYGPAAPVCVLIATLQLKKLGLLPFEPTGQLRFTSMLWCESVRETLLGVGRANRMDRSTIADVPRDKYVERCKQRAFDYLDRGDLREAVASFVNNMNARPDCELPHHLAALGDLLLMKNDVLGWKALIEEFR